MSYHPPFFFNTQQLLQSQQTSPGQQQSQQPQPLVQSSPTVASYQAPLPAVAPWHQHQQQTVYRSDIGTRYVYDNANQTSISANRTAISANPTSHLSMTDKQHLIGKVRQLEMCLRLSFLLHHRWLLEIFHCLLRFQNLCVLMSQHHLRKRRCFILQFPSHI